VPLWKINKYDFLVSDIKQRHAHLNIVMVVVGVVVVVVVVVVVAVYRNVIFIGVPVRKLIKI